MRTANTTPRESTVSNVSRVSTGHTVFSPMIPTRVRVSFWLAPASNSLPVFLS